jgi:hypothetical protein
MVRPARCVRVERMRCDPAAAASASSSSWAAFYKFSLNSSAIILTGISNTLMPSGSPSTCVTQLTFSSGKAVCRGNKLEMVLRIVERRVTLLKIRAEAITRRVCGRRTRSAHDARRKNDIRQTPRSKRVINGDKIFDFPTLLAGGRSRPVAQDELLDQDRKQLLPYNGVVDFVTTDEREVRWVEFALEEDENSLVDARSRTNEFKKWPP